MPEKQPATQVHDVNNSYFSSCSKKDYFFTGNKLKFESPDRLGQRGTNNAPAALSKKGLSVTHKEYICIHILSFDGGS